MHYKFIRGMDCASWPAPIAVSRMIVGFFLFAATALATPPYVKSPNDIAPRYGYFTVDATTQNTDITNQSQLAAAMIDALQVAKKYVETIDAGKYAESWQMGDAIFQRTASSNEWSLALSASRGRLGAVKLRTLKDEKPAWNPAGLPPGAYMVVEYNTAFDRAPNSGELLTLRQGEDGKWRVLTYQVN